MFRSDQIGSDWLKYIDSTLRKLLCFSNTEVKTILYMPVIKVLIKKRVEENNKNNNYETEFKIVQGK